MIANVWPEASHLEETISTLRFASRMTKVQNETSVNIQLDRQLLLKKYEREIRDLKLELAMHDTLAGRGRISYEPYTVEQQYEVQKVAENYLNGKEDDIEIQSIRQVKELFIQFRNLYRNATRNMEHVDSTDGFGRQPTMKKDNFSKEQKLEQDEEGKVGKEQKKFGFGMGKAPKNSKPTFQMENSLMAAKKTKDSVEDEEKQEDATQQHQ